MPKRVENICPHKNLYTNVQSTIIHNRKWKKRKSPLTDEWMNKMWYIHPMEYYSVIKGNEVLIRATTRMNLENIMLREKSQAQKATYCIILFV